MLITPKPESCNKKQLFYDVADASDPDPVAVPVPGPVYHYGLAFYALDRPRPPPPRIVAVVAVVAHREDSADWYRVRAESDILFYFFTVLAALVHAKRLIPLLAVYIYFFVPYLDLVSGQSHDPLYVVL